MCHLSVLDAHPPKMLLPKVPSAGRGGGSIVTPPTTSVSGDGRSTQTPLVVFIYSVGAHRSTDYTAHASSLRAWSSMLETLSPAPTSTTSIGRATPPPLAAYTSGGGHSSSGDSTSTNSTVSTAREIARLRHLPIVETLTTLEITRLECLLDASFGSQRFCC